MKFLLWGSLFLFQLTAFANQMFPTSPDPGRTPGSLCSQPSEYRYPEKIAYCSRNVSRSLKQRIIAAYDATLGYKIGTMDRGEFKIDHYIPLCMGGSNEESNLWPQHSSVYNLTDLLEEQLCQEMSAGALKQADAVQIMMDAKADPFQCQKYLKPRRRR